MAVVRDLKTPSRSALPGCCFEERPVFDATESKAQFSLGALFRTPRISGPELFMTERNHRVQLCCPASG